MSRQPSKPACRLALALFVLSLLSLPVARAQDGGAATGSTERPAAGFKPPLQPLPKPPSRKLPPPEPADVKTLDELLDKLLNRDRKTRQVGLDQARNVDEGLLSAIRRRIDREAQSADRARMKRLLLDTRRKARSAISREKRAAGDTSEVETPDYLEMLVRYAQPDSKHWRKLVTALALSRMCVHLGSVQATRVLIRIYVRFAFLRIDTQLQLKQLGDRALAALIEHTRHPAPEVASWAKRQLDFFGKAIPSETAQVDDPQVLADVLRAYGYIKDPGAGRLITSFANSEQAVVRDGAREAVVLLGEVGNWQLRDTYEKMVGRKPSREWSWDRTARELFREFDRIRLSEVYTHYTDGMTALQAGDLNTMVANFDKVLTRSPKFSPADDLVRGYLAFAEKRFSDEPERAQTALSRVLRIATNDADRARAESLLLTLDAQRSLAVDLADQMPLQQALKLDETNVRAKQLLTEIQTEPLVERSSFMRAFWPILLCLLGIIAAVGVLLRRPTTES